MKARFIISTIIIAVGAFIFYGAADAIVPTVQLIRNDTVPSKNIYTDIQTGDTVVLWYDSTNARSFNVKNKKELNFFVNRINGDTVFGRGRIIVNGLIIKENGVWVWDPEKVTVDDDGSVKIKDQYKKIKIDADGSFKIKTDSAGIRAKQKTGN